MARSCPLFRADALRGTQPAFTASTASIALRIAMVAADEADLVAALRWGHEWDIAAAALIAEEAGGKVTDAHGRPLRFNSTKGEAFGVLATGTPLHPVAVARLEERARKYSVR